MKNKKIIIGFAFVLAMFLSGCDDPDGALPPEETGGPTPLPEEDEEAWQDYQDPEGKFSLMIPPDFAVNREEQNGPVSEVTLSGPEDCPADAFYCFSRMINIRCLYNQGGLTAEDWFSEAGASYEVTGNIEIAGQNAIIAMPRETEGFATRYVFTAGSLLPNGTPRYIFDLMIYSGISEESFERIIESFTVEE